MEVRLDLAMTFGERFAMPLFVERVLEHPHAREVAVGLIYVLRDASGRIASLATPAPGAGLVRWVDRAGREIDCAAVTHVEVAHPLAMDAAGAGLRDAFRSVLAAAGRRQAIPQLDRPTFSALDGWPVVRGTVVSYRKLERLVDRRGWRLYRTHCGSALHDWSYLQRTVDVGRVRISLGFNFGEHVGDSTLGELIGQDEDGTPGVRHAMRPSPEGLSAIAMSELQLDLATLRG